MVHGMSKKLSVNQTDESKIKRNMSPQLCLAAWNVIKFSKKVLFVDNASWNDMTAPLYKQRLLWNNSPPMTSCIALYLLLLGAHVIFSNLCVLHYFVSINDDGDALWVLVLIWSLILYKIWFTAKRFSHKHNDSINKVNTVQKAHRDTKKLRSFGTYRQSAKGDARWLIKLTDFVGQ